MPAELSAAHYIERLEAHQSPEELKKIQRYFKSGPGGYGEGDLFMGKQADRKKTPESHRKELYELYIRRMERINNWDLVDLSAHKVVGGYLFDKQRDILYPLARSESLWERRIAMFSTMYFIKQNDLDDSYAIAEILLNDEQDLVHKVVGWALRTAGGQDRQRLLTFLDRYAATMPRTLLRYAIENLEPEECAHYMSLKNPSNKMTSSKTTSKKKAG